MEKVNLDVEFLITLVEARPVLWDKTLEIYKDRVLTRNAWEEICKELHSEFEHLSDKEKNEFCKNIKKKWWNIRDGLMKSRKKVKDATRSSGGASMKNYVYNDQLQFLLKVTEERQTADSLSSNNGMTQEVKEEEVDCIHNTMEFAQNVIMCDNSFSPIKEEGLLSQVTTDESATPFKAPQTNSRKRKADPLELKMIKVLEDPENRHLSFFKGILPSLNDFSEDEIITFQIGVLQLISNIKRQKATALANVPV